jgi:hypothetical protein
MVRQCLGVTLYLLLLCPSRTRNHFLQEFEESWEHYTEPCYLERLLLVYGCWLNM